MFDKETCPKCGGWVQQTYSYDPIIGREYLRCKCLGCGYVFDRPCKDSSENIDDATKKRKSIEDKFSACQK